MNHNHLDGGRTVSAPGERAGTPALVALAGSIALARELGPLPWTAFQHLVLTSRRGEHGWEAPIGVRDVALGIGVTKDTAARAVSLLVRVGLVSRARVEGEHGRQRSGYRVQLPEGMRLLGVDDLNALEVRNHSTASHKRAPRRTATDDHEDPARWATCNQPPLFETPRPESAGRGEQP